MKHSFTILLVFIIITVILSRRTFETLLPGRSPLECPCGKNLVNQGVAYDNSIRNEISNDNIMPSL
jgi:hypothetical protein